MSEHSWKNIYNLSTDQLNDLDEAEDMIEICLLYTSPSPRDPL